MFPAFLSRWFRSLKHQPVQHRQRFSPQLLALEDRNLPSTFTVKNLHDSGGDSLRAAIIAANANPGADTIVFAHGLTGTIKLTSGELSITDAVTISGPGADKLTVSGNGASRVFEIDTAVGLGVAISGLTISHGYAPTMAAEF